MIGLPCRMHRPVSVPTYSKSKLSGEESVALAANLSLPRKRSDWILLDAVSLRNRLLASQIATANNISGCTEAEIDRIRVSLRLTLPKAYLDFLRVAGKRAGAFLRDVDIFYPKMLDLRQAAEDILNNWEEGGLQLPAKALVFAMRRGDQFMYFVSDENSDDPPIWHYVIGSGGFKQIDSSIWNLLESEMRMSEDFRRRYPNSPLIPNPE